MPSSKPDWKTNEDIAAGKGATVQEFLATVETTSLKSMSLPGGKAI